MLQFEPLKAGDLVELVAPASRCSLQELDALKTLLHSWQLDCLIRDDIFGDDLLCAHRDEIRFNHLKDALYNPSSKAIICVRGGYGSLRLIPQLMRLLPPKKLKMFVGMSDITCLHLFFQQRWHWPTIHGAAAPTRYSPESIHSLKKILFAETQEVTFQLKPLNAQAQITAPIDSTITGGNLAIIQAGIGTSWQIESRHKLILLEEINERAYRVDRMLAHLSQAHVFDEAAAVLLGDFLGGEEPNGSSLIDPVLHRFAQQCPVPVFKLEGVGHGFINFPIPCGTPAQLQPGKTASLRCLL